QLYVEERFIEPPRMRQMPLSLAFHQTLSVLASSGELKPSALADRILSLPPMEHLTKETYRSLLLSMVQNEYLELTDEKGLIVGLKGEKLVNSFKFYAVFKDSEDYTVRKASEEIGTITNPVPVGERFALAGRVWEVEEIDLLRKLIYVHPVEGKMEISWPGDSGEIHTKVLRRMKQILFEDVEYPYLMPNAKARLWAARHVARRTGLADRCLISLSDSNYCLFPWLGTRAFRTLKRFLASHAQALGVSNLESEGCCYMTFRLSYDKKDSFLSLLCRALEGGIDPIGLVGKSEAPVYDKYDEYIPTELLREAYAIDRLAPEEVLNVFLPDAEGQRKERG
ncbi:MAG: ATP-dependent helicase, partial [Clostridia bacterium]|nr:ATP-dependent helicase [Clostridia bacterium]